MTTACLVLEYLIPTSSAAWHLRRVASVTCMASCTHAPLLKAATTTEDKLEAYRTRAVRSTERDPLLPRTQADVTLLELAYYTS